MRSDLADLPAHLGRRAWNNPGVHLPPGGKGDCWSAPVSILQLVEARRELTDQG
jgi:hypothetical protein